MPVVVSFATVVSMPMVPPGMENQELLRGPRPAAMPFLRQTEDGLQVGDIAKAHRRYKQHAVTERVEWLLDWERHDWSSAVQGEGGVLTLPTMIRVLCGWREVTGSRNRQGATGRGSAELLHLKRKLAGRGSAASWSFLQKHLGSREGRPQQRHRCA